MQTECLWAFSSSRAMDSHDIYTNVKLRYLVKDIWVKRNVLVPPGCLFRGMVWRKNGHLRFFKVDFLQFLGLTKQVRSHELCRTRRNTSSLLEFLQCVWQIACIKFWFSLKHFSVKVVYLTVSSTFQAQSSSENFAIKEAMVFLHILYPLIFFLFV